jgi:hypothetical protein
MKKNLVTFLELSRRGAWAVLLAASLFISSRAYGALVAEWDLNSPSYTGGTPTGVLADYGSQSGLATLNGGASGTSFFSSGGGTSTVNSPTSGSAGNATVMANFFSPATMTLTFHLGGNGLSGFVMTYATQEPDQYNESQNWSWSTTGSSYTALASVQPGANSIWGAQTIDFSSANGLNNASDVYLQLSVTASDPFQIYFDNFKISATAVPEVPITGAVMGFGALAIALGHTLRRKFRQDV